MACVSRVVAVIVLLYLVVVLLPCAQCSSRTTATTASDHHHQDNKDAADDAAAAAATVRPAFVDWPFVPDLSIGLQTSSSSWHATTTTTTTTAAEAATAAHPPPGARVSDDDAQRLLVRAAVPLSFDSNDTVAVAYVMELLRFAQPTREGGVCPALLPSHGLRGAGRWLFASHAALAELFGERRAAALRALQLPHTWRRLEQRHGGRCGGDAACVAAQSAIAAYESVDPPGEVHVRMIMQVHAGDAHAAGDHDSSSTHGRHGTMMYTTVPVVLPFADMYIYTEDDDDDGDGTLSSSSSLLPRRRHAQLRLDVHASARRRLRQRRIQAKRNYYVSGIAEHDAALRAAALRASRALATSLAAKAAATAAAQRTRDVVHAQLRMRRQQQQQQQRDDADEVRAHTTPTSADEDDDAQAHDAAWQARRRAHMCDALRRVLITLHTQRSRGDADAAAVLSADTRVVRARELQRAWRCRGAEDVDEVTTTTTVSATTTDNTPASVTSTCAVWCDALHALAQWRWHTGDEVTVAQSLALLTALYVHNNNNNKSSDNNSSGHAFVRALCAYSIDYVEQRRYAMCGKCSRHTHTHNDNNNNDNDNNKDDDDVADAYAAIVAELHYASGVLRLLCTRPPSHALSAHAHDDDYNSSDDDDTEAAAVAYVDVTGWARAVLQMQQAMWLGARRSAAAALATMREHGLLQRQHRKGTVALLMHAMDGASADVYRQLLSQQQQRHIHHWPPQQQQQPRRAYATAERLLRYERVYAVTHGWAQVDWPVLTRARVQAMMHAEEPTLHEWRYGVQGSSDAPPHNNNVYAEGDDGDGDGDGDGDDEHAGAHMPLAIHLENTLQKTNLQLGRVRGVRVDARGAACRLLTVLRRMRYTCDVQLRRRRHSRAPTTSSHGDDTNDAVAHVDDDGGTCAQHVEELRYILSEPPHTRLGCGMPMFARSNNNNNTNKADDDDDVEQLLHTHAGGMSSLPPRLAHYRLLQHALVKLSYAYLLDAPQQQQQQQLSVTFVSPYARVALYAALSLRLSAAAYAQAVHDARAACTRHDTHTTSSSSSSSSSLLCATMRGRLQHSLGVARRRRQWAAVELLTQMMQQHDEQHNTRTQQRQQHRQGAGEATGRRAAAAVVHNNNNSAAAATAAIAVAPLRLPTLLHSSFVPQESLMLLAVSALLELRAADDSTSGSGSSSTTAQQLLQHTLHRLFGIRVATTATRTSTAYACVYTLLAAAQRWRSSQRYASLLDHTRHTPHRTDAFVLLGDVLYDLHGDGRPASLALLRRLVLQWHADAMLSSSPSSAHVLQTQRQRLQQMTWLLPRVDDTIDVYARRLLRFAYARTHAYAPAAELLARGLVADDVGDDHNSGGDDDDSARGADEQARRQRGHVQRQRQQQYEQLQHYTRQQRHRLDHAVLSHYTLRALRLQWQFHTPPHELHTLLVLRDAAATLTQTRATTADGAAAATAAATALPVVVRLWRWLRRAVLYLYTQTDDEVLLQELSELLLPPAHTTSATRSNNISNSNSNTDDDSNNGSTATATAASSSLSFAQLFVDVVATSRSVQQLATAALLVSSALQLGTPHGFTLLLADAAGDGALLPFTTTPSSSSSSLSSSSSPSPHSNNDTNTTTTTTARARRRGGNAHLQPLAHHMAAALWDRHTTAAQWRDEHITAQWQREKATRSVGVTALFSLDDAHAVFRHAAPDARSELAAQLDRWRARRLLSAAAAATTTATTTTAQQRRQAALCVRRAEALLAQCSGHLMSVAFARTRRGHARATQQEQQQLQQQQEQQHAQQYALSSPRSAPSVLFAWPRNATSPYDGALLPAANLQCLTELYTLLRHHREPRAMTTMTAAAPQQQQHHHHHSDADAAYAQEATLLRLVRDVTARLRYVHALSNTRPRDRLAASRVAVGSDEGVNSTSAAAKRRAHRANDDDDADNSDSDDDSAVLRHATTQLVEPWRRVRAHLFYTTLVAGEGVQYNARLHRVTGVDMTARLLQLYTRARHVCARYTPRAWQSLWSH